MYITTYSRSFLTRFHCRYNYAKLRIQERIAREGIKNKILYESTHLDPDRKQTNGNSSNWTESQAEKTQHNSPESMRTKWGHYVKHCYVPEKAFNHVNKGCVSCSLFKKNLYEYLRTYSGPVSIASITYSGFVVPKINLVLSMFRKVSL